MARVSKYEDSRDGVLALIQAAELRHSKPPTVRDLASGVGVGVATMHAYLQRLAEEGLVEWQANRHRSLHLTPAATQLLSSPAGQSV